MSAPAGLRRLVVAMVTVVATGVLAAAGAAQALPADDPAALRPGEIQRLFDAYLVMEAQRTLGLSDTQFPPFLTRLRGLQEIRRQHLQARNQLLGELGRLTAPKAPGDEAVIRERLTALRELDARHGAETRAGVRRAGQAARSAAAGPLPRLRGSDRAAQDRADAAGAPERPSEPAPGPPAPAVAAPAAAGGSMEVTPGVASSHAHARPVRCRDPGRDPVRGHRRPVAAGAGRRHARQADEGDRGRASRRRTPAVAPCSPKRR